jgi:acyl-coenzyme A synthetase/AMP-(fatty) acid ligase
MSERTPIAPLEVRRQFMTDPSLGAGNFLQKALELNPNREVPYAFTHRTNHAGDVELTGHSLLDLDRLRRGYSAWYAAQGVHPGEVVGVFVSDGLEPLLHFLGLTALGAIPAMVNDAMPIPAALRYFDHVGVAGVVADDSIRLVAAYREAGRRPRFVTPTNEVRAYLARDGDLPDGYPYTHRPDDVVALIHSSGTTGIPKATMLGHRQFWDGKQPRMERFPAEPYDRLMSLMPHTHAGGLSYFLTTTLLGLPTVVMSDWRRVVVEPVMEAWQPTMVASFPRTFVELATGELPVTAAANVHTWFNTGDSAHHAHVSRLVQLGRRPAGLVKPWLLPEQASAEQPAPGSQYVDGLGSSEMGMALFGHATTVDSERKDRCLGKPVTIVHRAAVLDVDGNELPDGTVGLLAVDSPSLTAGYWNDPGLTESSWLAGYWLTGDVAYRDVDGNYFHLDRTVDVMETATGPVYTLPIEEVLLADCGGLWWDLSVVGVPSADGSGQAPVAMVRPNPEATAMGDAEQLATANKALEAAGLTPLAALFVARQPDDFPLGVTGKALKRELRARLATSLSMAAAL